MGLGYETCRALVLVLPACTAIKCSRILNLFLHRWGDLGMKLTWALTDRSYMFV